MQVIAHNLSISIVMLSLYMHLIDINKIYDCFVTCWLANLFQQLNYLFKHVVCTYKYTQALRTCMCT
jgi:hypothetical protein